MSCSSLKQRFEELKSHGNLDFITAITLFNDVKGSLDAHRLELTDLENQGDRDEVNNLREHIDDGEKLIRELGAMKLH
jgi:hypothetical protein